MNWEKGEDSLVYDEKVQGKANEPEDEPLYKKPKRFATFESDGSSDEGDYNEKTKKASKQPTSQEVKDNLKAKPKAQPAEKSKANEPKRVIVNEDSDDLGGWDN